jgi:hypothetical protein
MSNRNDKALFAFEKKNAKTAFGFSDQPKWWRANYELHAAVHGHMQRRRRSLS